MSRLSNRPPNQPWSDEAWHEFVRQTAQTLPYPATPDVANPVMARLAAGDKQGSRRPLQFVWVASMILALLVGLWAVPPVRAAIREFLQIGVVRIWLVEPTPSPVPSATRTDATAEAGVLPEQTPLPTPTPLRSLLNLVGRTTLAEAQAKAGFEIRLPTYPAEIGQPDEVFYQELGGPVVVLVWRDPQEPSEVKYSLHILGEGALVEKGIIEVVTRTTVAGNEAVWTTGPYILAYGNGDSEDWELRHLVSGHVLVWFEDDLTYRLESGLSLDEAKRIAESLE